MGAKFKNYICALGDTDSAVVSVGKKIAENCGFEFRFFEDHSSFEDLIRENSPENIVAVFSNGYFPEKEYNYNGSLSGIFSDPVYICTDSDYMLPVNVNDHNGVVYLPKNECGSEFTYNLIFHLVSKHSDGVECFRNLENYRNFFHRAPLPYQSLDENGNFIDVNLKWTEALGYSKAEVLGKWFGDFVSPDCRDFFVRNFLEFKREGEVHDVRFMMVSKTGELISVSFDGCIDHYPDGSFKGNHCIFRNISEEDKTGWELEKARVSLRFTSDPMGWISTDGTIIDANDAACKLTGYSGKEIAGHNISEFYNEITPGNWGDFLSDLRKKESVSLEISVNVCNGLKIPFLISFSIFVYKGKEFIFAFGQDISLLKAQEKLLQNNIFSYEKYFSGFQGIAYLSAINRKPVFFRGAVEKITGYSEEDFISGAVSWDRLVLPEDLDVIIHRDEELRTVPGFSTVRDYRITTKSGGLCWVRDSIRNVSDQDGYPFLLAGSLVDVTEQKKAEEINRRNEERYRILSDASDQAVVVLGEDHKILFINNFASEILGFTPGELEGHSLINSEIPGNLNELQDMYSRCVNSGKLVEGNYSVFSDGHEKIFHVRFTPQRDDDGSASYLLTANDITESISIEEALKKANHKMKLLSEITRHDILNCITALDIYEDMLSEEEISESAKDDLEMMMLLTEQIKNLAVFTRDYQNLGSSAPKWYRIDHIVDKQKENPNLSCVKVENIKGRLEVFSDRMIEKVFYNLFMNSVCHGGDKMDLIKVSFSDEGGTGVITVEDNGKGVWDDNKSDIFLRSFGENTGLGLFLAKEILSLTDTSIEESGIFGEGAKFVIKIPPGSWRIFG
ncbi:PAS domain-containing protein [Methanoplanus limicola]|uniref:histidine kinase n=1 Tax=Methanoplanus limicola DSM 2279 TaxID=937775 RepID=H1YZ98_9EURY|nr:PAS domain S-box protein [Methanoplanus limicola]EHQ35122.1 PAS/PAC sensor signal transduction histidine kinase [Methanoplanus limicola DSM 2279]